METIRTIIKFDGLIKLCFQNISEQNHEIYTDEEFVSQLLSNYDKKRYYAYSFSTETVSLENVSKTFEYRRKKEKIEKGFVYLNEYFSCKNTEKIYFSAIPLQACQLSEYAKLVGQSNIIMLYEKELSVQDFGDIKRQFECACHDIFLNGNGFFCPLYSSIVKKYNHSVIFHYSMFGSADIHKSFKNDDPFCSNFLINSFDIYC